MKQRPEERNELRAAGGLSETQQQKRVGGIAEREHRQHNQISLQCRRQRADLKVRLADLKVGTTYCGPFLFHPQQQHNGRNARYRRQRKQRAVPAWEGQQEYRREQRAENGARMIHGAMEAVDLSAIGGIREIREHRVPRRAAYPLADTIDETQREDASPRACDADERPREPGERIAGDHNRLTPAPAVGEPPGDDLQHAAHGVGCAFDDAKRHRRRAEDRCQKKRQQRIDGLARDIVQQADEAE